MACPGFNLMVVKVASRAAGALATTAAGAAMGAGAAATAGA